jgi:type I restriction enzyme R subunit
VTQNHYSGDQIRFLRSVQDVFLARRRLAVTDLYDAPLTNFGRNAVDRYFTPDQVTNLVRLTDSLSA